MSSVASHRNYFKEIRKSLTDEWKIKDLIAAIKTINTQFYPQPFKLAAKSAGTDGAAEYQYVELKDNFLTLDMLVGHHGLLNYMLHERSAYRSIHRDELLAEMYPDWLKKVKNLLETHVVLLPGMEEIIFVEINENGIHWKLGSS